MNEITKTCLGTVVKNVQHNLTIYIITYNDFTFGLHSIR